MADSLQKLVQFFSDPGKKKKRQNDSKKKPIEIVDKEVWNITGGFFPMIPTTTNKPGDQPARKWVFSNIIQKNPSLQEINHWVPAADKDKMFACEKFNIKIDLQDFTQEQFEELKDLDSSWSFEETKYLWELCNKFDLRFVIISDRYDSKYCRSIEDLKQRFYSVTRKLLEIRQLQTHPLANYKYDPEYERIRKFELEKFLLRTKETNENEKDLIESLRKKEIEIKKEEKEHQTLQKMLKECIGDDFDQEIEEDCVRILHTVHEQGKNEENNPTESICYLRGKWLSEPLPISEKMNKKLNLVMNELCVPSDLIATRENEILFEQIREGVFEMFNLQKVARKKELAKKQLEEKKRKILEEINFITNGPKSPSESGKRPNPFVDDTQSIEKTAKKLKQ